MNSNKFIERLNYTKYIYETGIELLAKGTSITDAMSILFFHDASEHFLLIVADKLGISTNKVSFLNYWEKVESKKKHLPNKNDMSKLNQMRVSFKHHGILPNPDECRQIPYVLNSFFSSVSQDILGVDFSKISLADLVEYDDVNKILKKSEKFLNQGNYEESITESAEAFKLLEEEKK